MTQVTIVAVAVWLALGTSSAQANDQAVVWRLAVAHEHDASWCLGYLTVSMDRITYIVEDPPSAANHGFDISWTDLRQVHRWVFAGMQQDAVEISFGRTPFVFW